MKRNRSLVFVKPGHVEVRDKEYPGLIRDGKKMEHAVVLKVILSGICGSDLHMYRGRLSLPEGMTLGHEITGQVIECGRDVEFIKEDDIVSVPFNVACGRCKNCKEQKTNICLHVNPAGPGAAYGYTRMGNWQGGQAEYVVIPYADFNLLKLPPLKESKSKLKDLALITDVFPTGYHAAFRANVEIGSKVYIAGAGPVGLSCALSCTLLGAAVVIVGDVNRERLKNAREHGHETIDLSKVKDLTDFADHVKKIIGSPEVDCFIDCVGFEAVGYGAALHENEPSVIVNAAMQVTKSGGSLGIPGLYTAHDMGGKTEKEKQGILDLHFGSCWHKGITLTMGQTPVMRYNRKLMEDIMHNKCAIAKELNVQVISLDEAPEAYEKFNAGAPYKFLIDPHGMT